jgi:hypothetical protein
MLIDARTVPDGTRIECDVAIFGAGAAGLTIAREFIGGGRNVCLVESGGLELDPATQALYEGDNVGLPYFPLDVCRLRFFGGTTNHWGGVCLPFKREDFERQPWLPHSGWPIGLDDMRPHIERAVAFLDLPEAGWNIDHWERMTGKYAISFDEAKLRSQVLLVKPVRMGLELRQEFEQARGIHVYLNANAVEIETTPTASHVTGVQVQTLAGNQLTVVGRVVVLALGGIENPRLLLLSHGCRRRASATVTNWSAVFSWSTPCFGLASYSPPAPASTSTSIARKDLTMASMASLRTGCFPPRCAGPKRSPRSSSTSFRFTILRMSPLASRH